MPLSGARIPGAGRRRSVRTGLIEIGLLVASALVVAVLVKTFLVQAFVIPSGSMEPTLRVGDRVLVEKVTYRVHDPRRGDVVVFDGRDSFTPEGPSPQSSGFTAVARRALTIVGLGPADGRDFVKRVVGVAGDRVRCCDGEGRVTVNGTALSEADHLFPGDEPSTVSFDVRVPPGMLWLMGDHRSVSQDSRAHLGDPGGGMVPVDRVLGRAVAVVWPARHWTGLGVPEAFVAGPITTSPVRRADLRRTVPW